MEPCQGEPSPAEWSRAPGELSGRRANKRGRRSGRRRKVGPGATGEGGSAGNRRGGVVLGAEPAFVVSRFSDINDAQKLGSGRAEKSLEPHRPHSVHIQLT